MQARPRAGVAQWLREQLAEKQRRNPRYSLRALALTLDLSPGYVSRLLNGTRPVTSKVATQIAERLSVDPATRQWLFTESQRRRPRGLASLAREAAADRDYRLAVDQFRLIADWYHYPIFCLADLPRNSADPRWIATRLGISRREAEQGLRRLVRLGIVEVRSGSLHQLRPSLATTSDLVSPPLRHYHRQNLRKAEESLERDPIEARDITSCTVAIDPKNLPEAKRIIRNFRKRMSRFMETGNKQRIYTLAIQLFPVDIPEAET